MTLADNIEALQRVLDGKAPPDRRPDWLKYASYSPQEVACIVISKLYWYFGCEAMAKPDRTRIKFGDVLVQANADWLKPRMSWSEWIEARHQMRAREARLKECEGMW